ncbi:MAG TPA: PHP domain-containing protein [bacterium]|nr:PHP domain-containing protein [bacterium]
MKADLHVHTKYSDGLHEPAAVVAAARDAALTAIAITDHDTVAGVEEAVAAGARLGVRVIPGIEFSAERGAREYHVLGYGLDIRHPLIEQKIREIQDGRGARAAKIVALLRQAGIDLPAEKLVPPAGGVVGRMHIARLMVEQGQVKDNETAFRKYLRHGRPAYVPHTPLDPVEIVQLILVAGGIPVGALVKFSHHDAILAELIAAGLRGLEVWHRDHTPAEQRHYAALAQSQQLLMTGGSDWHGDPVKNLIGPAAIPAAALQAFLAAL